MASFQHARRRRPQTMTKRPMSELETFRGEFREYTDEDEDDEWPDEFLTLD